MTELASSIKALRKQNRMTQDDLAAKLNVTRQTVSNYENGKSEPDIEMLVRIAEVFHTDVNSLVNMEAAHQEAEIPKHWSKAVGLVAVTIAAFTLSHYMEQWANTYGQRHYNFTYGIAVIGFFYPIFLALLGYTVVYFLQQFAQFPAPKPIYKPIRIILTVCLLINCCLYLPQVVWSIAELLQLAGVLPIEGKLRVWDVLVPLHLRYISIYPKIWYTFFALCGAGIAITQTKTPKD